VGKFIYTEEDRLERQRNLPLLALIVKYSGMVRLFIDGDSTSAVFNWWNPLNWILFIICIPICAVIGEKITSFMPFTLSEYWQERKEKILWL
jgi:hypothetical protein